MQKAHLCRSPCEGRARQKASEHHRVLRNFCFAGVDAYGERTDPVSCAPRLPVLAGRHHPAWKLVASESRCGAPVGEWRRFHVLQGFSCCLSMMQRDMGSACGWAPCQQLRSRRGSSPATGSKEPWQGRAQAVFCSTEMTLETHSIFKVRLLQALDGQGYAFAQFVSCKVHWNLKPE